MSLVTVVYNPSVDEEWHLDDLCWDEKNLIKSQRSWAGGKGVNIARWLGFLGERTKLLLPLGGSNGREVRQYLRKEGIFSRVVQSTHETRRNVVVTLRNGRQLRFNSSGLRLSSAEEIRLLAEVRRALTRCATLILSGSLPAGTSPGTYSRLIRLAGSRGCRVLLDCDGEALRHAVPAGPFLVKPNELELSNWWGRRIRSLSDVLRAAKAMSTESEGWVLVSRGADPSVLVHAGERVTLMGHAPRGRAINTLGAGDAMLAGAAFEIVRGSPPAEWLKTGVVSGTAATRVRPGFSHHEKYLPRSRGG